MKALTIKQPWAGLIIAGIKNVENRTWSTKFSGPLAIHAGAKADKQAEADMRRKLGKNYPEKLCSQTGVILGTVDFNALVWVAEDGTPETDHPTITTQEVNEWWNRECVGFIFENPRALPEAIQAKGALGLWNVEQSIEHQIRVSLNLV